jgi:hypothetical protein
MKKIVNLGENTIAIIENNCITIVQKLINEDVVVLNKHDIKKILDSFEDERKL